jgi:DDB1- and CUL4-associated factor 13
LPDDGSKANGLCSSLLSIPLSLSLSLLSPSGSCRPKPPRDCSQVMASSIYLPKSKRGRSPELPVHTGMGREKFHRHAYSSSWTEQISLPIPGVRTRRLRILVPKFDLLYHLATARLGHRRGPLILIFCALFLIITGFSFSRQLSTNETQWPRLTPGNPSTLVFQREDIKRIWQWEVESGHYPSRAPGEW